ncbi:autotransporter domain-containing protein [Candidatus Tisiphia endosymbiont of Micropterix aruncella]|uniref:autotransporter domain-containing protein n=1 Tax=Candidatus Tisiphia endosymbiont of Micropterix aruncella TaxID=3066271 RepID=UPI003AA94EEE
MMVKKQKFFKNLLASSAIASVVASLGSSNVALAAGVARGAVIRQNATLTDGDANANWNGINNVGRPLDPVVSYNVDDVWKDPNLATRQLAITYGGGFELTANRENAVITAINLAHNNPGRLTVNENLSIGSIVSTDADGNNPSAERLPITIAAGRTLTLTGTVAAADQHGFIVPVANTYTGLGNVTLGGNDADGNASTLVVGDGISIGAVTTNSDDEGRLTFLGNAEVIGEVGTQGHDLEQINLGDGTVTLHKSVHAEVINFNHNDSILKVNKDADIDAHIEIPDIHGANRSRGTLIFEGGAGGVSEVKGHIGAENHALAFIKIKEGQVTFGRNVYANNTELTHENSVLNVGEGVTITGSVDNTTGADNKGILNFEKAGGVTGTIGGVGQALAEVNFGIAAGPDAGGGVVNLRGAAIAADFNINHNNVIVIARGLMTGTVNFNAAGRLTAHFGIAGNVNFKGHAGTIILGSGKTITGAVDNTGGVAAGVLNFAGAGTVTGAIGATNALTVVNFGGTETGVVELQGAAKATSFNINNPNITVNAAGLMKGAVNFNGTGRLNANAGIEGNVDFKGNDGIITLGAGQKIEGNVDNDNVDAIKAGILNFARVGEVTGAIGATCALAEVNFGIAGIGGGAVQLGGASNARNFNINHDAADVTAAGLMRGNVNFNAAGNLNAALGITGNVNFKGHAGTITLGAAQTITGAVTAGGVGTGTLTFAGIGTVTGDIGADGARLHQIITGGVTTLRGSVYTDDLHFGNAVGHAVTIGGHFGGKVTFDAVEDGTLTFNGAAGPYTFDSAIEHGDHGTLNVRTNLTATNAQIGNIKTINIGTIAPAARTLTIDASKGHVNLLGLVDPAVHQKINFLHADSILGLYTKNNDSTIIFHDDLPGLAGGGGFVFMEGKNATLTLQSAGGKSFGAGDALNGLLVAGRVTIVGSAANKLDVHNAQVLHIINGARFTDKSATSAQIKNIHIGADFGAGAGPATYILDAEHGVFNLNATKADQITFDHADAQLTLRNSAAGDKTITLVNNLDPGAAGADGKGIVELHSVVDGETLTIAGVGLSLGTGGNNLKKVIFSGAGKFNTQQITIHSKNIELNVNELTLGAVNSNILFATNTVLTANGDITGNVDFQDKDGTVRLAPNKNINGSIIGGVNGTLEFLGDATVTRQITNLKVLKAGVGDVQLAGVNHNIKEIQGNGNNNLIFATNCNLTGSINSTGGTAVGLIFKGNNGVTGVVGTDKNPVGTIEVQVGTTRFGDKVQTDNNQDIIISNGATAEFASTVTTHDIKGEAAGQGTVKFSNAKEAITVSSTIGAGNSVYTLEIAGADVAITQAVSAKNISFSNAKEATLTLNGTSTVDGISTVGNNVHTLALAADFSTGIQDIGSEKNRLKSIKLLGDHKITINSAVYSDVSTKDNNTGKVVFNSDRSFAYNLGTEKLRLSDVTFDNNATVKGDVYSKQITIANDKTATFAGTKNRTISVPNLTVDGSSLSRLLKSFAYSTQIVSDEIKNAGIAKFDNAVLVDAKINGGKVTFVDNVWFKQTADGTEVSFAANKFVILEQNIRFANIKADKAKIIILPKTASITGNLAAKDFTVDLAANKLQYTGKAQLTGKIELVTAYDTSSGAGGNIEVQKDSELDLSKADQLIIKVNAQTDVNKIPKGGTQYFVISSVDGKGLVAIDNSKVSLDSTGEQNRFVKWSMDSSDLKLYITDISNKVLVKDSAKYAPHEQEFVNKQLLNATGDAAKFRGELGKMDQKNAHLAIEKLLPGNEHSIGESLAKTSAIMGTLISQTAIQIASRQYMRMHNPASAIGSGDDDQVMYGVWGSPFYGTACQEMYEGVSGYKSKSAGGIVGFDGLVNDNLLLGAAYSRINTQMSHQNQKVGDKTNGKTNIFSLYSLYNFPNNWFTEAIASYGITRVKNSEGRLIATKVRTVTALETAAAKYKSISYSGQLLAGYNYQASEKLMITPTIGLRYLQFKDAGYTETGTKFQNLAVKKRSYNKLEGILGLRTAITLKVNEVLLIPELHGYVNHDFKGKAPIIDARLDGINEPLSTRLVKPAKTSFTVGTGLTAKYNMMECGVTYNANIASKYIGHQGSLKVKVNF